MESEAIEIRLMTLGDIPVGMRLCAEAGWNQTAEDWRRFLTLQPDGCYVASRDGRTCGTVTSLNYGKRFGWISMLLVDTAHRGRGTGTRLLLRAAESLERQEVETLKLDATPMGHPLYRKLGFADEYSIERWEGVPVVDSVPDPPALSSSDFERICRRDRDVFGADRSRLLSCLWNENPKYCAVARSASGISGYVLGRAGSRAHYIGPVVAEDGTSAAEELLLGIFHRLKHEGVYLDVCGKQPGIRALLEKLGFKYQRTLIRMYRGPNRFPGTPHLVCAIAGPDLG